MRKKLLLSRPAAESERFLARPSKNRSFFINFRCRPTPNGLYFETIISHAGEMCVYRLITTFGTLVYCQKDTKIDKTHCRFLFLAHIIIQREGVGDEPEDKEVFGAMSSIKGAHSRCIPKMPFKIAPKQAI